MADAFLAWLSVATGSDFFAGGIALGAIGLVATLGRALWRAASAYARRRLWVSLTLDNRSPAYRHLCLWIAQEPGLAHVRHVRLTDARWSGGAPAHAPAPGTHWFLCEGRLCRLTRHLSDKARVGGGHTSQRPLESIEMRILGGRLDTILGWIAQGARLAEAQDRRALTLHIWSDGYWSGAGEVRRRPLSTVALEDDAGTRLLADMRRFYARRDWYEARGIPWRRGYLLHGPPGTGKSTLIRALASEMDLDIATIDVGRPTLSDDDLREAMITAPRRCVIAIEDIDAVFRQRDREQASGVSFSGLLNAIDGVGAQEGRALIMTTNHADRLDPALIRPGRADLHVRLGLLGAGAARRLFDRFFPGETALGDAFEAALGDRRLSPAELQAWLIEHAEDPRAAARCDLGRPDRPAGQSKTARRSLGMAERTEAAACVATSTASTAM